MSAHLISIFVVIVRFENNDAKIVAEFSVEVQVEHLHSVLRNKLEKFKTI
jgi:hypothetical protein